MSPLTELIGGAKAYGWGSLSDAGDFQSIATATVGSGGAASVTFSSIPATFAHLQLRMFAATTYNASDSIGVTVNNDTTTTYRGHQLGTNVNQYVVNSYTDTLGFYGQRTGNSTSGFFGCLIMDIFDYTSTNKNKTMRVLGGVDFNTSASPYNSQIYFNSGFYPVSNTAISNLVVFGASGNFVEHTKIALYGIKGA